jgi:hypothetical protein
VMADLGAEVIKIEVPEIGHNSRGSTVLSGLPSTYFETNNRSVKAFGSTDRADARARRTREPPTREPRPITQPGSPPRPSGGPLRGFRPDRAPKGPQRHRGRPALPAGANRRHDRKAAADPPRPPLGPLTRLRAHLG